MNRLRLVNKILVAWFCFLYGTCSLACSASEIFRWDLKTLYANTGTVVLAEAVDYYDSKYTMTEFEFKPVRYLKGQGKGPIELHGHLSDKPVNDFNAHKDKAFWENPLAGNNDIKSEDCGAAGSFKVGERYLLFLGDGFAHPKGQERIAADDDVWLEKAIEEAGR